MKRILAWTIVGIFGTVCLCIVAGLLYSLLVSDIARYAIIAVAGLLLLIFGTRWALEQLDL